MQTLFLEKKDTELRVQRACLLIYHQGKKISSRPLKDLRRVVVGPGVALSAGVLGVFGQWGIAMLVVNHRFPERTASVHVPLQGDTQRRIKQYACYQDETFRLMQARRLLFLKLTRQFQFLSRLKQQRSEHRRVLTRALSIIRAMLNKISANDCLSLASLRGAEGAAAAAYFEAFSLLFPPALEFKSRRRRPPPDPVNACLSLTYTLLLHDAVNALHSAGLDSSIGCLHDVCYQRDSLACDVLELLRPGADAWVYGLFNRRTLRAEDFSWHDSACELHAAGKQRFYQAWHQQVRIFRRLLRRYARIAAQEVEAYEPE